ncbi:MAG: type I glyceraldehyde-3-phosphate dehydrogenase, partial [Bacteroidota bacterium]|nr:type I glyceraldehyde-3-phosphate dehydrogenase [Bacteroidota bacterium]
MKRVAINGFGRIGRLVLRVLWRDEEVQIVAINDLAPSSTLAHLLEFDSAHGRWEEEVKSVGEALVIGEKRIPVFSEKDPTQLPWGELEVDLVLECSGVFRTRQG